MFADVIEAHREFHAEMQIGARDRLVVQPTEDKAICFVGVIDLNPHPFAFACRFVFEFRFDEVSGFNRHRIVWSGAVPAASLPHGREPFVFHKPMEPVF